MKLSNFLKKETKTTVKANIEKIEKSQLKKVIGGVSDDPSVFQRSKKALSSGASGLKDLSGLNH